MQQQQIVEEMSYVWEQIKIYWICSKSVFHTTSHNSMYACVRTCANYNCDHRMTAARTWLTTGQRAMTWYHRTQHTICGVQKLIINFNAEIIWYNHWHTGNTQYTSRLALATGIHFTAMRIVACVAHGVSHMLDNINYGQFHFFFTFPIFDLRRANRKLWSGKKKSHFAGDVCVCVCVRDAYMPIMRVSRFEYANLRAPNSPIKIL